MSFRSRGFARSARRLTFFSGLSLALILSLAVAGPVAAMLGAGGGESNPFANAGADASANFFTGAASARVPILLPPGRPLVTPSLSLG